MKKQMLLTAVLVLAAVSIGQTQELTHKVELSVGGSFQAWRVEGYEETMHLLSVPVRAGYFVTREFELEAEGIVSGWDEQLAGETQLVFVASANAVYNVRIQNSPHLRPFVLAGIGVTDSYFPPVGNAVLLEDADGSSRLVTNLGAGMKTLLGDRAAFRVEYRYQHFASDETEGVPAWTSHTLQMGVSLFL